MLDDMAEGDCVEATSGVSLFFHRAKTHHESACNGGLDRILIKVDSFDGPTQPLHYTPSHSPEPQPTSSKRPPAMAGRHRTSAWASRRCGGERGRNRLENRARRTNVSGSVLVDARPVTRSSGTAGAA